MADQIQIPNRTAPPAYSPVPIPEGLINNYINRQDRYAQAGPDAVKTLLDHQIQQQELKGKAFEEGGPYLMNMLYGSGQNQQTQGPAPTSQPLQDASTQAPAPAQATPDSQPSEAIQAHVAMGSPDFTGHLSRIKSLQNQMAGYQNMGAYGAKMQQGVGKQLDAEKSSMDAEQVPLTYAKNQGEVAMQPIQKQKLQNEVAMQPLQQAKTIQEMNLATTKPIAEEVSKQTVSNQQIGQIQSLYNNLQTALAKNQPGMLSNVSGKIFQVTGGRHGSGSAANVINAANPLATALNTELARRFNSGEVQLLQNSLIPNANDTPAYAQQKMGNLKQMIDAMKSGNEQSIQNVGRALAGQPLAGPGNAPQAAAAQAIPAGRITVISPNGKVGHIPQAQLKEALAAGYRQQ